jgi:hypothetical protein
MGDKPIADACVISICWRNPNAMRKKELEKETHSGLHHAHNSFDLELRQGT